MEGIGMKTVKVHDIEFLEEIVERKIDYSSRYLTLAAHDLWVIYLLYSDSPNDNRMWYILHQCTQQAFEKVLKAFLATKGYEWEDDTHHDITELGQQALDEGLFIPDGLFSISDALTSWYEDPGYDIDFVSDITKIAHSTTLLNTLFNQVFSILFPQEKP
jgi:hypothetical protein